MPNPVITRAIDRLMSRQDLSVEDISDVLAEINVAHTNRKHLGLIKLSHHIAATSRYSGADLVILAVPAQSTRAVLGLLGNLGEPVVLTAKCRALRPVRSEFRD